MIDLAVSRRNILKGGAALGALGLGSGILPLRSALAAPLTIGIVYVGPRDDFGWNQAHAVAAEALKSIPGVTVVEEENVPETDAVSKTMESMIQLDGAGLIFATSFGYFDPFMLAMAEKYPDVQFRHAAGLWTDKNPKNAGSYYGYLDQAHYVDGVAAGLATKSNKLGFVAAKPIGTVLLNINAFTLGARKANPNATVQVIFTGEWSMPVREAEAANALVDAGCDVVTCHVDSPKVVIETAESRGVKTCGHNASQAPLAPKGFITGAEYKWITIYSQFADALSKGETLPNFVRGGYDKDYVQNTAYGAGATPEAIKAADAAKADMKALKPIFVGPLKDNAGKEVIAAGTEHAPYDVWLEQTNYLVEGVVGSIT
ncbi:BMP family ABC transporter substrate-binding protein [Propylenella binzhouense]|uniref:BMP family ABC transporter substrate-binding protein n=1 Tax=Propylenella binzhouense TaxID=2555902 RepID=A0A964WU83_9HYPH|nr:BMP family ABC transporter substrate-binding protein [Propylenella binzhouense]MYZ48769.1 BMP family ABC transporter substrate-binding protein [Propylenella binzhouense]